MKTRALSASHLYFISGKRLRRSSKVFTIHPRYVLWLSSDLLIWPYPDPLCPDFELLSRQEQRLLVYISKSFTRKWKSRVRNLAWWCRWLQSMEPRSSPDGIVAYECWELPYAIGATIFRIHEWLADRSTPHLRYHSSRSGPLKFDMLSISPDRSLID